MRSRVDWAQAHVPAILEAWYPGQAGGSALADVLFGDYNPGGRLPVTFYRSVDDLPAFDDYGMAGHTYRFFDGPPLYPFGLGRSFTTLSLGDCAISPGSALRPSDTSTVSVAVENTGARAGDEVVQLYVTDERRRRRSRSARWRDSRIALAPGSGRR